MAARWVCRRPAFTAWILQDVESLVSRQTGRLEELKMCLMPVNKSFHTPLVCEQTAVNEFITLLRPKCTYCQVFLTVCDSAASPSFGKSWFVSSSHTILPHSAKKKKKVYHCCLWGERGGKTSCFCFSFSSRMFFLIVFTWVNRKIPSPKDDSSYDFTVWILRSWVCLLKTLADKETGLSLVVIHWPKHFLEDTSKNLTTVFLPRVVSFTCKNVLPILAPYLVGFSNKLKSWLFHFSLNVSANVRRHQRWLNIWVLHVVRQPWGQFTLLPLPTQVQITVFKKSCHNYFCDTCVLQTEEGGVWVSGCRKKILIITWPPCSSGVLRWMTSVGCDAACVFFLSKLLTHTLKHYRVTRETHHLNFVSTRFNSMPSSFDGLLLSAQ